MIPAVIGEPDERPHETSRGPNGPDRHRARHRSDRATPVAGGVTGGELDPPRPATPTGGSREPIDDSLSEVAGEFSRSSPQRPGLSDGDDDGDRSPRWKSGSRTEVADYSGSRASTRSPGSMSRGT